jgi:hypothetical protein
MREFDLNIERCWRTGRWPTPTGISSGSSPRRSAYRSLAVPAPLRLPRWWLARRFQFAPDSGPNAGLTGGTLSRRGIPVLRLSGPCSCMLSR